VIRTTKKKERGGSARERRDQESRVRLCFSLSFFFLLDLPNHKAGGAGRSGGPAIVGVGGGGARKRKNERHNATSNNVTRKHTNSTMQIIERKCKAQKVARTMI
jgi:hypothetical protein